MIFWELTFLELTFWELTFWELTFWEEPVCVSVIIVNFSGNIQVLELGSPHIMHLLDVFLSTGLFTVNDVHNMTDEIRKMKLFDHSNVMTLIGVCVSIGGGLAIIMPYMENGSLLSYIRKDKNNLIMNDDQDLDTVSYTPGYCYCHLLASFMSRTIQINFNFRFITCRNGYKFTTWKHSFLD